MYSSGDYRCKYDLSGAKGEIHLRPAGISVQVAITGRLVHYAEEDVRPILRILIDDVERGLRGVKDHR